MDAKSIVKIPWSKSIWFSDVDDTLINTASLCLQASTAIRKSFASVYESAVADKVQQNFNDIFSLIMMNHSNQEMTFKEVESFKQIWKQIEEYQKELREKYGSIKKFSREVIIKIACDAEGLDVYSDTIQKAADAYWSIINDTSQPLPGVLDFINQINIHNRPLYLFTGSDARFTLNSQNQFEYNPKDSEEFKNQRVQNLRSKGINFNRISIGDPIDKPHIEFFEKTLKIAEEDLGNTIDMKNCIIIGDSYKADLQVPKERMGFGLAVLFNPSHSGTDIIDEHQITTNNLANISGFLKED